MTLITKPSWWNSLSAAYGFANDSATTIDSQELLTKLNTYFSPQPSIYRSYLLSHGGSAEPSTTRIDLLVSSGSNDFVAAQGGADYVSGGAGDDVLYGDAGADILHGRTGSDLLVGNLESDGSSDKDTASYLDAGAGIVASLGSGATYVSKDGNGAFDILYGIDNIIGSDFSDHIDGQDGANNTLQGGLGDDDITGGSGNDVLVGGAGNDDLYGDAGNDIFLAGAGIDNIHTGSGQDKVVVEGNVVTNASAHRDTVYDFQTGSGGDKLDVSSLLFHAGYKGSNAVADGYIRLSAVNGDIKVEFDRDGSSGPATAAHIVTLDNASLGNFSTTANLVTAPKSIFYVPILGQSNGKGLSTAGADGESGVTRLKDGLAEATNYGEIVSMIREPGTGQPMDIAVGGTTVDGNRNTSYPADRVWWYPDQGKPGEILLRAVDMLSGQIADLRVRGAVTPVVVWSQGEAETRMIGRASNPDAAADRYKAATLAVFDYIKDHVGDDIQFYVMQTSRFNADGAREGGLSEGGIRETEKGLAYVRDAQIDMALSRSDVHIAANYDDLPMLRDVDPVTYGTDQWHTDYEYREIIGDRLAGYIAMDFGYTHVVENPGPYPVRALADLHFYAGASSGGGSSLPEVNGTSGDDRLVGPSGGARISGFGGVDKLIASGGDNILIGGLGKDSITLASGHDIVVFGNELLSDLTANADYIAKFETGAGGDQLDISGLLSAVGYGGSNPVADGYLRLVQDGTRTKLLFDADGSGRGGAKYMGMLADVAPGDISVADNIIVRSQPVTVAGGSGIDGSSRPDLVVGTTGEDIIHGNGGNDMIAAGAGADTLYGGTGRDDFIFDAGVWAQSFGSGSSVSTAAAFADIIEDFATGSGGDAVNLDILLEKAGYTGTNPVGAGYISVVNNTQGEAQVMFDADGSGEAAARVVATLHNVSASAFSMSHNLETEYQPITVA
jgi:Ca2+-binding RTX toxin-like protein